MGDKAMLEDKILITGASGQLGYELSMRLGERATNKPREAMDVTDVWKMKEWLPILRPDMIVHCAAYTDIIKAEREPRQCWSVNTMATHAIAVIAKRMKCPLLFVSTNMVFGALNDVCGSAPFTEKYPVGPLNVYGNSKAAAEHAVLQANQDGQGYWILRTAGLYERPWRHYRNFPQKVLHMSEKQIQLSLPNNTIVSSTYVPHLADAIMLIIENRDSFPSGIFNVTNDGSCSLYDLGREFANTYAKHTQLRLTDHDTYFKNQHVEPEKFPQYSVLSCKKFDEISPVKMPHWRDAVEEYGRQVKKFG